MSGPSARARRSGDGIGQRLLALSVFAVFGGLLWVAYSGRYDVEVNRIAAWLHSHFESLGRLLH